DNFPGAGRRVYPGFLQHTGFVAMNPDRHATSHYDYFNDLIKGDNESAESLRKFYDEYNAVLDMDADYYLETIDTVFQDFKLVNGTWDVKNPQGQLERVRPQDIQHTALLTIEGELDDISGSGQTAAAHDLCTGIPKTHRMHYEAAGAGHYGIFSGRRWREFVHPVVKAFLKVHQPTVVAEPAETLAAEPRLEKVAAQVPAQAAAKSVVKAPTKARAKPAVKTVAAKAAAKPAAKPAAKAPAARKPKPRTATA
ncbi:MAG: polyhydroxyalkanoate depolymerase, partial [Hydrogenophaga sp.]|nr:polyhydroxyalkanoate depolymerase [Hydrogenophaga sp.]